MKKGIECYPDYDFNGRWCLKISKKKGELNLKEIKEAAKEYELDFYLLVLDCFHEDEDQYTEEPIGDVVTLYRTDLFYKENEH